MDLLFFNILEILKLKTESSWLICFLLFCFVLEVQLLMQPLLT